MRRVSTRRVVEGVEMSDRFQQGDAVGKPKHLSLRDLILVVFAVAGVILGNVGVVRALDIALDVIHR